MQCSHCYFLYFIYNPQRQQIQAQNQVLAQVPAQNELLLRVLARALSGIALDGSGVVAGSPSVPHNLPRANEDGAASVASAPETDTAATANSTRVNPSSPSNNRSNGECLSVRQSILFVAIFLHLFVL